MSRPEKHAAILLEMGDQPPEMVGNAANTDEQYATALGVVTKAVSDRYAVKDMVIVDPIATGFHIVGSGENAFTVIGLKDTNPAEVMPHLYELIGQGKTICFPDSDGSSAVGELEPLGKKEEEKKNDLSERVARLIDDEGLPEAFRSHFIALGKFNAWIATQGRVDDITPELLAAATFKGDRTTGVFGIQWLTGARPAGPLADLPVECVTAFARGRKFPDPAAEQAAIAKIAQEIMQLQFQLNEAGLFDESTGAYKDDPRITQEFVDTYTAEVQEWRKTIPLGAAGALQPFDAEIKKVEALLTAARVRLAVSVDAGVDTAIALIRSLPGKIEALEFSTPEQIATWDADQLIAEQGKLNQTERAETGKKDVGFFPEAEAALSTIPESHPERASLVALIAEQKAVVKAIKDAVVKRGGALGEAAAKEAEAKVGLIDNLKKSGYYSASSDLSHNDAVTALKAYEGQSYQVGSVEPKTTVIYAGAFSVPYAAIKNLDALNPLVSALAACKAGLGLGDGEAGKITPPVTLRFLMNKPGEETVSGASGTGHNTILEVHIAADKTISVSNINSLMEGSAPGVKWTGDGADLSDVGSARVAEVMRAVSGAFGIGDAVGSGYSLAGDPNPKVVPNPLGTQVGDECIYYSVAEIAKGHNAIEVTDLKTAEAKTNAKVAVARLMVSAALPPGDLATKSRVTDVVLPDEALLTSATLDTVEKYKDVARLRVGDIVYLPVLENKRIIHEIAQKADGKAVEVLQKDASFIKLCRDLIKLNAPSEPALDGLPDAAKQVLITMLVMDKHREKIDEALKADVPGTTGKEGVSHVDRLNFEPSLKAAVDPVALLAAAEKHFENNTKVTKKPLSELLPNFMVAVENAKRECERRSGALAAASKSASPVAEERNNAFKGMTLPRQKEVMQKVVTHLQKEVKLSGEHTSMQFQVAKKDDDTKPGTGAKVDDVTVEDKVCKVHGTVTLTKKDGSTETAEVMLTRTVDDSKPNEVVRRCEVIKGDLPWALQCELMAKESFAERQEAGIKDTRILVEIDDKGSPRVNFPGRPDLNGKFTQKEVDLVKAYLAAGYTEVHCQNIPVLAKAPKAGLGGTGVKEGIPTLPGVIPKPPKKIDAPDVAATAPTFADHKKSLVCPLPLVYDDGKNGGLDAKEQAKAILDNAKRLAAKGYGKVMVSYSANLDQANELEALRKSHPNDWADHVTQIGVGSAGQGKVMYELIQLLKAEKASQALIEIAPLPTMVHSGGVGGPCTDADFNKHLRYMCDRVTAAPDAKQPSVALMLLQNQDTLDAGKHVGFGGAKGVAGAWSDAGYVAKHGQQSAKVDEEVGRLVESHAVKPHEAPKLA